MIFKNRPKNLKYSEGNLSSVFRDGGNTGFGALKTSASKEKLRRDHFQKKAESNFYIDQEKERKIEEFWGVGMNDKVFENKSSALRKRALKQEGRTQDFFSYENKNNDNKRRNMNKEAAINLASIYKEREEARKKQNTVLNLREKVLEKERKNRRIVISSSGVVNLKKASNRKQQFGHRQIDQEKLHENISKHDSNMSGCKGDCNVKASSMPRELRINLEKKPVFKNDSYLENDDWQFRYRSKEQLMFAAKNEERLMRESERGKRQYLVSIAQEAVGPKLKKAFSYSVMIAVFFLMVPAAMYLLNYFKESGESRKNEFSLQNHLGVKEVQASIDESQIASASKNFESDYRNLVDSREKLEDVVDFLVYLEEKETDLELKERARLTYDKLVEIKSGLDLFFSLATIQKEDGLSKLDINLKSLYDKKLNFYTLFLFLDKKQKGLEVELNSVSDNLSFLQKELPNNDKINQLKEDYERFYNDYKSYIRYLEVLKQLFGQEETRRILVLFQNDNEVRATGGYVGSYAVIETGDEGAMVSLAKSENLNMQTKEKIIPPKPIQKVNAYWTLNDSNWWPDFPTSAQKAAWFYEKSGGPAVDGVMTVSSGVIEDLLKIVGPIEVIKQDNERITVSYKNFRELIKDEISLDYDQEAKGDSELTAMIFENVLNKVYSSDLSVSIQIFKELGDSLRQRRLMIYYFDYNIQELISNLGWSGEMINTNLDYLGVVNTKINAKTIESVVRQKIIQEVEIQNDGTILSTVSVKNEHLGGESQEQWFNQVDSNWLRIYVPRGSELVSAEGFSDNFQESPIDYVKLGFRNDYSVQKMEDGYSIDESSGTRVYDEGNKTVFANWVLVSPGEIMTVKYKYLLPFRLNLEELKNNPQIYSIFLQKQAGEEQIEYQLILKGMDDMNYLYRYPEKMTVTKHGWDMTLNLDRDRFFALIVN